MYPFLFTEFFYQRKFRLFRFSQRTSETVRGSNLFLAPFSSESWELVHGHGHFSPRFKVLKQSIQHESHMCYRMMQCSRMFCMNQDDAMFYNVLDDAIDQDDVMTVTTNNNKSST